MFILNQLKQAFNADMAMLCGGNIRGTSIYTPGQWFTGADLQREFPFDSNRPIAILLPGQVIEDSISYSRRFAGSIPQGNVNIIYILNIIGSNNFFCLLFFF